LNDKTAIRECRRTMSAFSSGRDALSRRAGHPITRSCQTKSRPGHL
jgi:hypothetical protein